MIKINIHEAKTHLSKYAKQVKAGQTVILCDRNVPFAEIRPLGDGQPEILKFGVSRWVVEIPEDFNESVPEFEEEFHRV